MEPPAKRVTPNRALPCLLIAAALMFGLQLGATDLWAPDEPRFGAVSEELRAFEHGARGMVVLHLNGAPYSQKPPLYYWVAALLGTPLGRVTEVAARLPSALAGIGCIWLTATFATALSRKPRVGIISGAVLLTVFRFAHFARRAQLDVILCFFVLFALFALYQLRTSNPHRGRWFIGLHLALALAVLTKGPVGLLPIPAFALYLAWQGNLNHLPRYFPAWSFAISLGPALVWLGLAVSLAPPGFFGEAVVDNLFGRFFGGTAHIRGFSYFFVHFPLEFLPWTLIWPLAGIWSWRHLVHGPRSEERDGGRLLLVWIGLCFVFFSISAGKRGLYLLPVFPAVAILCGLALDDWLSRRTGLPRAVWCAMAIAAIAVLGFGAVVFGAEGLEIERYPGFALPPIFGALLALIAVFSFAGSLVAHRRGESPTRPLLAASAGIYLLELLVFSVAYPAFDGEKSPRPIAEAAAALSRPGAPVGVFDHTALVGGIAYYSGRRVHLIRDPASLTDFLEAGGRNIIVKHSKLERFPRRSEFEIRARARSGSRTLTVIGPVNETPDGIGDQVLRPP